MFRSQPYLVKICGNRFPDDAEAVARQAPDFMGWIFAPASPRRIPLDLARLLLRRLRRLCPRIRHVGVFAGNSVPEIARILGRLPELELAQVVDGPALIEALRSYLGRYGKATQILPALRVSRPIQDGDLLRQSASALYVLDSYVPGQAGGTGRRLAAEHVLALHRPFLLAGGLTPENVAGALAGTPAIGADVSSGLEFSGQPGRKDPAKVRAFVRAVRQASRGE